MNQELSQMLARRQNGLATRFATVVLFAITGCTSAAVEAPPAEKEKPRARDLGIPFEGKPGKLNAITDVAGVEVGHETIISGKGTLVVGKGPVRTGVTAILPRGRKSSVPVFAATFALNGFGEMTGTAWVEESGMLESPVMLTNTYSVGVVRDAVVEWQMKRGGRFEAALPVVGETFDGFLNDIGGFHVKKAHAFKALNSARSGPVAEGNVGAGTGLRLHRFKGGIGTASRVLSKRAGGYTVGVLVQGNYGNRRELRIAGVPVGKEIPDLMPTRGKEPKPGGSIIIVVATDAPLLPHQLKRLVKRATLGLARNGSVAADSSGDIFIAFSTANPEVGEDSKVTSVRMLPNSKITPLFTATVQATEEAIINAMIAAETMTGINGNTVHAIPHERLQKILRKYNRLDEDE